MCVAQTALKQVHSGERIHFLSVSINLLPFSSNVIQSNTMQLSIQFHINSSVLPFPSFPLWPPVENFDLGVILFLFSLPPPLPPVIVVTVRLASLRMVYAPVGERDAGGLVISEREKSCDLSDDSLSISRNSMLGPRHLKNSGREVLAGRDSCSLPPMVRTICDVSVRAVDEPRKLGR